MMGTYIEQIQIKHIVQGHHIHSHKL